MREKFDGSIEINGILIYYNINSEIRVTKKSRTEPTMGYRTIYLFDSKGNNNGSIQYYADFDKLTNISSLDVLREYKESKNI